MRVARICSIVALVWVAGVHHLPAPEPRPLPDIGSFSLDDYLAVVERTPMKEPSTKPAPPRSVAPKPAPSMPTGAVAGRIVELWPGEGWKAVVVAQCESKMNPNATGSLGERGLFQIHPVHKKRIVALGFTWDQMYEVDANVAVAADIWQEQSWGPWSCKP